MGGVITFLLVGGALLAVVLAFVVVVLKRKRKAKDDSMDPHNGFILENAIYDGGTAGYSLSVEAICPQEIFLCMFAVKERSLCVLDALIACNRIEFVCMSCQCVK